jgi:hypothetical protein
MGVAPQPVLGTTPQLQIINPVNNAQFAITGAPAMPVITVEVRLTGFQPDPTPVLNFTVQAQIRYNANTCPHGQNRDINLDFTQTATGGRFDLAFPSIRGGSLTLTISTTLMGQTFQARTQGLVIVGTNPQRADVAAMMPHDTLSKIACQESGGMRQFAAAANGGTGACPLWSADNLGGVGIMQITRPTPTDDEVWDWTANVRHGIQIFNEKLAAARGYPQRVRNSQRFQQLVQRLNQTRQQQNLPPLTVTVPPFTSGDFNNNLQQLELDAIRGYNGFGGRDAFGMELHEFRVVLDAAGQLVVDIVPGSTNATTRWERVPAADRPQSFGDPNYVQHVLAHGRLC